MAEGTQFVRRWGLLLGGSAVLAALLFALRGVLTPVFFAFLIAYVLDPAVDRIERWGVPRTAAIALLLLPLLAVTAGLLVLGLPAAIRELVSFAEDLPDRVRSFLDRIEPSLASYGIELPHTLNDVADSFRGDAQELAGRAVGPAAVVFGWVVGGTASVAGAVASALLVPVFAFYMLHDFDNLVAAAQSLVPWRVRKRVSETARDIDHVLGQFLRGQLTVMLILGVLYAIGFSVLGVRLAIWIGAIAGLLAFIPYVGGGLAVGLALVVATLDGAGWPKILGVLGVWAGVQILDALVITPRVIGGKVGISPAWVLFALLAAGHIFGFMGVLLAVPAAAAAKIVVGRMLAAYKASNAYLSGRYEDAPRGSPGGGG